MMEMNLAQLSELEAVGRAVARQVAKEDRKICNFRGKQDRFAVQCNGGQKRG